MASRNIAAWTAPGTCPPYVSINRHDNGRVTLAVRERGLDDDLGRTVFVSLTAADWATVYAQIVSRGYTPAA